MQRSPSHYIPRKLNDNHQFHMSSTSSPNNYTTNSTNLDIILVTVRHTRQNQSRPTTTTVIRCSKRNWLGSFGPRFLCQRMVPNLSSVRTTPAETTHHDFLFFPKLITEIWDLQLQFWRQYQENRHTDSPTPTETSASLSELQAQIRHLYTLSDQVLQTQRPRLFPPDIDVFLDTNNMSQLQAYISQYTPAIRLSIRQATKRSRANTRSLHSYGFTPQTNTSPNTQPTHIPPSTVPPPPDVPPPIPDTNLNLPTLHRPRLLQRLLTWANIRTPTHTQSPPSLDDHPTQSGTETTPRTTIQSPQPSTQDPPRSTHTRAPHHKHSRWRPPDLQRQQFLNFFRR